MRKIGIITIIDNNYGNRLQNYAMQLLLKNCGFESETIRFSKNSCIEDTISRLKIQLLQIPLVVRIRNTFKSDNYRVDFSKEFLMRKKNRNFKKFNKKYIHFHSRYVRKNIPPKNMNKYFDYFVAGSDQIWNPNYSFDPYITYLRFAPKNKRIAIAASFGVEDIAKQKQELVGECLKEMQYISVREESGKAIVEKLTDKACDVCLDPTLLIDSNVWKDIVLQRKKEISEKYVLTYFLGEKSKDRIELIEKYAKEKKLKIIHMNDKNNEEVYCWGPEMFLQAIYHCDAFFTDSFHGCVFSIIFHKQFFVFQRQDAQESMFSRIQMLLNTVGLERRKIDKEDKLPFDISMSEFACIDKIIIEKQDEFKKNINAILSEN